MEAMVRYSSTNARESYGMRAESESPEIAVVVSTYNRARRLEALVRSLERQDFDKPYELVIVDNGSSDDSCAELQRLVAALRVPLKALRIEGNSGPARARNVGWRSVRADKIAFTDDDCSPQRGWLAALAGGLDRFDIVQGRTQPDPSQAHLMGPFTRSLDCGGETGFYEASNIAYRRGVLERLDGFNEALRYAGEDTDLGLRARTSGASFTFTAEALAYHDVVDGGFAGYLRNTRRWEGVVQVVRLHPELKRFFSRGPFWLRSHTFAAAAALGIGLSAYPKHRPIVTTLGLALTVPYIVYRLRARPLPGATPIRVRDLPLAFIGNLAEALTHVVSQIRFALASPAN
jgi:glycosyltransferase involved in cell wall biosynthesis